MKKRIWLNGRKRTLLLFLAAVVLLAGIGAAGAFCHDAALLTDFPGRTGCPAWRILSARTGWEGIC